MSDHDSEASVAKQLGHARHKPLAQRAIANGARARRVFGAFVLCTIAVACDDAGSSAARKPPAKGSPEARVAELVENVTPLEVTVTSDITDARFHRQRELLAELSAAGPEVGRAALAALADAKDQGVDVERALLTVGAKAAPKDAQPLLESLVTQYGPALSLRTEATFLLAETAPERALELLEPYMGQRRTNQTLPPMEFLVAAWVTACDKTGRSPVPVLVDVATDLLQTDDARVRAIRGLGAHPDPIGEHALRTMLVESTGNAYLRRIAAQMLRDTMPRESACELFRSIADKEADINFLKFLADMLEKNCGS